MNNKRYEFVIRQGTSCIHIYAGECLDDAIGFMVSVINGLSEYDDPWSVAIEEGSEDDP